MYKLSSYLEQQDKKGDDNLYIFENKQAIWFCLSDGAGGTGSGDIASNYIINAFKDLCKFNRCDTPEHFEFFLREIDLKLSFETHGGEATAIVGKIKNNEVIGASVGDSEAWLFNLEYDYELTSMQHIKPLIGNSECTPIGFGPMNVEQSILIGSDGLFKYSKHKDIKNLSYIKTQASEIAKLAKKETGKLQDDIAVIYIDKNL